MTWGEPYDRVLATPKKDWDGHWLPNCDFQAGYFQCGTTLGKRYSPKLETFYLYCQTCGSAYPVREVISA